jgi:hypothetical protein
MSPVDVYQQRASECLQFAATSPDFDDRTTWRELALCWLRLSDHAARLRGVPPTPPRAAGAT